MKENFVGRSLSTKSKTKFSFRNFEKKLPFREIYVIYLKKNI